MSAPRTPSLDLGAGREFDAVRAMCQAFGDAASGIGDDAAVLRLSRGDALVASVDAAHEGVHFRREWLAPREVGWRAATAALSDLAAMGARPVALLVAVATTPTWEDALAEIAAGIADAARAAGAVVAGGNTTRADSLSLTTTVLGEAHAPLTRSGARPGDRLYVTGTFGGPAAAVRAWNAGGTPSTEHRARFARPVARCDAGRWLAAAGASACVDVSDGLAADLAHVAAASDARVLVDVERLPLVGGVTAADAASSGEEFELAVCAPHDLDAAEFAARFGVPLTIVGRIESAGGAPGVTLRLHGAPLTVPPGHDHLSR